MNPVSRYHPVLAALHWLLAILIIAALTIGFFRLAAMPNSDPGKIDVLAVHMAGGMLILFLMVIRLAVRFCTRKPAQASTGYRFLDAVAPLTHYGLYLAVFAMAATGFATSIAAGLPSIVFARSGAPLPPSFMIFPTRIAHGYIALVLAGLILLHALAALYHQIIRKDDLFVRMAIGPRPPSPSGSA